MNIELFRSDAMAIARGFRAAKDADTLEAMNAFSSSSKDDIDKLMFYVVSTRWMAKAWPFLSGKSLIEDDNSKIDGTNTSNLNDGASNSDWRVEVGMIENAGLLADPTAPVYGNTARNKVTVSNASSDNDDEGENDGGGETTTKATSSSSAAGAVVGNQRSVSVSSMTELKTTKREQQQLEHTNLDRHANFRTDYVLVGSNAWLLLRQKFGYDVEIPRKCVYVANGNSINMNGGNDVVRQESPVSVEIHPETENLQAVRIPIPPNGHFIYDKILSSVSSSQQRLDWNETSSQNGVSSKNAVSSSTNDALGNNNGHPTNRHPVAAALAAAIASKQKQQQQVLSGNVSDDETADDYGEDLFPQVDENEDRMSLDNNNDSSTRPQHLIHTRGPSNSPSTSLIGNDKTRPSAANGTNRDAILLLPPSTTVAAAEDNSNPQDSSWLDSSNASSANNNNNDNNNDMDDDANDEILTAPGRIRKPYGSGLGNLGNTCFMSCSLQCLAHTDPLRKYFLSGEYEKDLNKDNPLGTGGDLAIQFASLLGEMWGTTNTKTNSFGTVYTSNNTSTVVYPRNFKYTLGRHAEQFVGYDQHDSQELLTYLLDALHEDTNRVTKKPYVEKPEQGEDETDEEASEKAWALHLKREDSKVLEYFMGQIKSRVQCCKESCGRVSTTFDPCIYLSVPIPGSSEKTLRVTFVPLDPTARPREVKVTVTKTALMPELGRKLLEKLVQLNILPVDLNIAPEDLCLVDVFQRNIYHWFAANEEVDRITENDMTFAYQLRPLAEVQKLESENATSCAKESSPQEIGLRERSNKKKYNLDLATMTRLNHGDAWINEMNKYLEKNKFTGFTTAFNPRRGSTAERVKWYNRVCQFIDLCYSDVETEMAGQKRMRVDDAISDPNVSPDEDPLPSIRERCGSSPPFENVNRRHDVAVLEFLAGKMRREIIQMEETNVQDFPDGVILQIRMRKYVAQGIGSKEQKIAAPLIIRIPSNTTVYGLREILSKALVRALKTERRARPPPASGESTSERSSSNIVSENGSLDAFMGFGDPALLIMRRVPLAYDRNNNSAYRAASSGMQLGSLEKRAECSDESRPVTIAGPNDEEEKALVAQVVGQRGIVYLDWPEELANEYLDVEELESVDPACVDEESGNARNANALSVQDCIEKFCTKEQLEETEMWYCNRCKEHVRAWKQFHLYRSPPILIIHLKRFCYSASTHRRDKINTFVDFPLEGLDLTGQVMHWTESEKPIYDCYGVSHHFGGLGGGHYTAHCLNDDGVWCYYDDSRISTHVDPKDVVASSAYVLFYRRRDVPVGEDFVVDLQTPAVQTSPAVIQDPLDKSGEQASDVSSSNAAMVDEDTHMDVDDFSAPSSVQGICDQEGFDEDPDDDYTTEYPPLQ